MIICKFEKFSLCQTLWRDRFNTPQTIAKAIFFMLLSQVIYKPLFTRYQEKLESLLDELNTDFYREFFIYYEQESNNIISL